MNSVRNKITVVCKTWLLFDLDLHAQMRQSHHLGVTIDLHAQFYAMF